MAMDQPNPPSDLEDPLAQLHQDASRTLDAVHAVGSDCFNTGYKHFSEVSTLFQNVTSGQLPVLESASNQLARIARTQRVLLPFFGHSSSGKSTILNALLGGTYVPSGGGHTTGRVCILTYASDENAEYYLWPIDKVYDPSIQGVKLKPDEDMDALVRQHLVRPSAPSELSTWCRYVFELRYPFRFLASPSCSLVDMPGFSVTDHPDIVQASRDFLASVADIIPGVVFVYDNASFSTAERSSYLMLRAQIPPNLFYRPSVFLVNSKMDLSSLARDRRIPLSDLTAPDVEKEISSRFSLLARALSISNFDQDENHTLLQDRFCCVNAAEALFEDLPPESPLPNLVLRCWELLTNWALALTRRKFWLGLRTLHDILGSNYELVRKYGGLRRILIKKKMALSLGQAEYCLNCFETESKKTFEGSKSSLVEIIRSIMDHSSELKQTIVAQASKIIVAQYDQDAVSEQAIGAFNSKLFPLIWDNLLILAISKFKEHMANQFQEISKRLMYHKNIFSTPVSPMQLSPRPGSPPPPNLHSSSSSALSTSSGSSSSSKDERARKLDETLARELDGIFTDAPDLGVNELTQISTSPAIRYVFKPRPNRLLRQVITSEYPNPSQIGYLIATGIRVEPNLISFWFNRSKPHVVSSVDAAPHTGVLDERWKRDQASLLLDRLRDPIEGPHFFKLDISTIQSFVSVLRKHVRDLAVIWYRWCNDGNQLLGELAKHLSEVNMQLARIASLDSVALSSLQV